MFRILHLSDVHIGKTYKEPDSIACKVASDIDYNGLSKIKAVIVTGDIFDGQVLVTDSLVNEAVGFFDTLLNEINYNQEEDKIKKEDFIFIPGNHDLIRVDDIEQRWSKYNKFLKQFYGIIPLFYNPENYSVLKQYDDHKIVFAGFNSCQIEKRKIFDNQYISKFDKHVNELELEKNGISKSKLIEILEKEVTNEFDDFGYIPLSQIMPIERKIRKLDNYVVIALFHHHFYLFPEIAYEFGDSSLVRNHTEVIQHLKYMNVSVVLHGHKHFDLERPLIMDDYYNSPDNIIDVFAGGSVGTDRKDAHTFSIIDLYEKKDDIKLMHNKFVYHGESLGPIKKKQVPPQKASGRIVKLLEILETLNYDVYQLYSKEALKAFKTYDSCCKVIEWVSEAITGFTDIYKYLNSDYKNILFLLYAVNYRVISYRAIVGHDESYFKLASENWKDFYRNQLAEKELCISLDDYHGLFHVKKLEDITKQCDKLLNQCENRKTQVFIAFTMLGIFFSDLFLVMTEYADDFKESIKYKVNIKIEENKFHENVPAPRIVIKSDADRRSVYVQLLCNEATAHKMAVLFVKEFDLLINKFEDYFKIIGLKLYYLLPQIDKDIMKNTLDNYNFEAYIPTLLPLLTGDNIYPSKVVFARELIQNSIDAIAVREAKDEKEFSKCIFIEINKEENRYFKIIDHGTGMDRYKIERYFTSIGRSFYSGEEYKNLNISYKPISNFGIGFLSSFMVCREIDVKTKYFIDNSEGLKLHIPNYDGCFFIERDKDAKVGTELKLYLNCAIENKDIVHYIKKVMLDIKYDIDVKYLDDKNQEAKLEIPGHSIRNIDEMDTFKFFIPFTEKGEVLDIDYEEVIKNTYISKYEYGILIKRGDRSLGRNKYIIMNAGIVVEQASIDNLFNMEVSMNYYYKSYREEKRSLHTFYMNFPANWLQLDVSREKITGFSELINPHGAKNSIDLLRMNIAKCLYKQILSYTAYVKKEKHNVPVIYLEELLRDAIRFAEIGQDSDIYTKLKAMQYHLKIRFTRDGVIYGIKHLKSHKSKNRYDIDYVDEEAKNVHQSWMRKLNDINGRTAFSKIVYDDKIMNEHIDRYRELQIFFDEMVYRKDIFINERIELKFYQLMKALGIELKFERDSIFILLTLLFLVHLNEILLKDKKRMNLLFLIEAAMFQYLTVGNTEECIVVKYKDLEKVCLVK